MARRARRAANTETSTSRCYRLDFLIGPGAPLDTRRFCIVAIDALGNGLSSSPSSSIGQPGSDFPPITIRDMVESQRRALDRLGIGRLSAVVGASMGGMRALQWAVSHPARMDRVVAMTPMSRTPSALEAMPSQHALTRWLDKAETDLGEHGPDPFDWCCQSRAYDAHNVGTTPGLGGDSARAWARIDAAVLIAAPANDLYNPPFAARAAADSIARARYVELPGDDGHRSASGVSAASTTALGEALAAFLR